MTGRPMAAILLQSSGGVLAGSTKLPSAEQQREIRAQLHMVGSDLQLMVDEAPTGRFKCWIAGPEYYQDRLLSLQRAEVARILSRVLMDGEPTVPPVAATVAQRQSALREARRQKGLKEVRNLWCRPSDEAAIRKYAADLQQRPSGQRADT